MSMREGWKYKSFGEVSEIVCGQDYKSVQDKNGAYPIYGTGGIMGYASQFRCPANSIIIGRKGSINSPLFVEEPFWNVDTAFGVVPNISVVVPKYFYYFCRNYDFSKHDVSVTIPSLRRTDILKIEISVPSLAEQEQIVAELDLLTGIIEKQKAQLAELDTLAQSIFYDMFGDPVENEKGWEQKYLGQIAFIKTGPFGSMLHKNDYVSGGIPLVNPVHMRNYIISPDIDFTVTTDKAKELNEYILHTGDVVFARRGDIGRCAVVFDKEDGYLCGTGSLFARFNIPICSIFLMHVIRTESFKNELVSRAKGATMLNLNSGIIAELKVPIPPKDMQESFVEKIRYIELQKNAIQCAINESNTLLGYTMDKYFS